MSLLRKLAPDKFPPEKPAQPTDYYILQYYIDGAAFFRSARVLMIILFVWLVMISVLFSILIMFAINNPEVIGSFAVEWFKPFFNQFLMQFLEDIASIIGGTWAP